MIDALAQDPAKLSGSTRLVIDEIRRRGWQAYSLSEGSGHLFVDRGDGKRVHVFGTTPPQQGHVDAALANNKNLTNLFLQHAGIRQLPFMMISPGDVEGLKSFIALHSTIVVKPVDGSHGNGIRLGVNEIGQATEAIAYAKKFTNASRVLIQAQFEVHAPYDLRLLCMDGKFVAAIHRMPARVFGDGTHTIEQLIDIENGNPRRDKPYVSKYASIDRERAREYLGSKIDTVPTKNHEVRVMDVANYGAGGELIDVTDEIPEWMRSEAELAAKTLGITVAGVDYLTSHLPAAHTRPVDISSTIIEVNKSPALMIHDEPHVGHSRNTVKLFLDIVANY